MISAKLRRLFAAALILPFALGAGVAVAASTAEDLAGLWYAERVFGPQVSGQLVLQETDGQWTAEIAGRKAAVSHHAGRLEFRLQDDLGSFKGQLHGDPATLTGHWIQPPTETLRQRTASPVRFTRQGDAWVGTVTPRMDRLRLYLNVVKDDGRDNGGGFRAFIRNPERNLGIFHRLDGVELIGPRARFLRANGELALEGRYHNADGVESLGLYLPFPSVGFDFRRVNPADAKTFYPYLSQDEEGASSYHAPQPGNDNWATADAAESGLRVAPLEDLIQRVRQTSVDALDSPALHSILVAHKGRLVVEEYFHGYDAATPHDTRSMGEAVSSMLIGAAFADDRTLHTERTLSSVLGHGQVAPRRGIGAIKRSGARDIRQEHVTLGELLSTHSGLACNDAPSEGPNGEGRVHDHVHVPATADAEQVRESRSHTASARRAAPCANTAHLAMAAIAEARQLWLPRFFEERLAQPLGMRHYHFSLAPDGALEAAMNSKDGGNFGDYPGGRLHLTPRDQLKLGQVMLDGGMWQGQRVLTQRWVQESLQPQVNTRQDGYAYGWWSQTMDFEGRTVELFFSSGNGGQLIVGIPEMEIVVQISGGNYNDYPVWSRFLTELIPTYILPAATR